MCGWHFSMYYFIGTRLREQSSMVGEYPTSSNPLPAVIGSHKYMHVNWDTAHQTGPL